MGRSIERDGDWVLVEHAEGQPSLRSADGRHPSPHQQKQLPHPAFRAIRNNNLGDMALILHDGQAGDLAGCGREVVADGGDFGAAAAGSSAFLREPATVFADGAGR